MSLAVAVRSIEHLDQLDQLDKLVASAGSHRLAERRHAMPNKRTRAKQEERDYNYGRKSAKKHIAANGLLALLGSSADTEFASSSDNVTTPPANGLLALLGSSADTEFASTSDNVSTPLESPADAANTDGASPLDSVTTPMQLPVESLADIECAYPRIESPSTASNTIGGYIASALILRSAFKNKAAPTPWTRDSHYARYCAVCGYGLGWMKRDAGKSVDLDQDMPNPRLTDKQLKELENAKFDRLVTEHISRKCKREGNAWILGQSVESVRLSTDIDILNNNVNISHDHSGNNSFGGRERGDVCMEF